MEQLCVNLETTMVQLRMNYENITVILQTSRCTCPIVQEQMNDTMALSSI